MNFHESNYFIDWIGIYIPFVPRSEHDRGEAWSSFQHDVYETTVDNLCHEHFYNANDGHYKELLNKNKSPYNIMKGKKSLRLEFRGSFFPARSIKEDILHFEKHYNYLIKFLQYGGMVKLYNPSVYRLDVSANKKAKLRIPKSDKVIDGFIFNSNRKCFIQPYQRNIKNPEEITGYTFGKRGRQSVKLDLYDKKFDSNKFHDLLRFGDDDFLRIEYNIGSDKLKQRNLKSVDSIFDLAADTPAARSSDGLPIKSKEKIHDLLEWLHWSKSVTFSKDSITKWKPKKIHQDKKPYNAKATIQSLIFNHTTTKDRVEILENLLNYDNDIIPLMDNYLN